MGTFYGDINAWVPGGMVALKKYVPGLPKEDWERFWKWWEKEGKRGYGYPPNYEPEGEDLEPYAKEWEELGKPDPSRPKGRNPRRDPKNPRRRRRRDFNPLDRIWEGVAEVLEKLPRDETLYRYGERSRLVGYGAIGGIVVVTAAPAIPALLPAAAERLPEVAGALR